MLSFFILLKALLCKASPKDRRSELMPHSGSAFGAAYICLIGKRPSKSSTFSSTICVA